MWLGMKNLQAPTNVSTLAFIALCAAMIPSVSLCAEVFPSAEISNGLIRAKIHLPDPEKGSYRGTRFDWSGVIVSLEYKGHNYFGQWYERHDPLINDAITGPVEEFQTEGPGLGFSKEDPGGPFVRIGVGVVSRPVDKDASGRRMSVIVNPGRWEIARGSNWIEFTHRLSGALGYDYVYTKRITLVRNSPEMTISHRLRNLGTREIRADVYDHNFFMLDGQPSGTGFVVRFPFAPRPVADLKGLVEIRGTEIHYLRQLERRESVLTLLEGFGNSAKDYDITVENRTTGAGVRIRGDRPLSKLQFWSIRATLCPEPFIAIRLQPGKEMRWNLRYRFW
jgi:hypothetical protein